MAKQLRENLLEMSDDEDFVEAIEILRNARRRRKRYRDRIDHFLLWNDDEFIRRFRLSKQGVRFVVNQIEAQIKSRTEWNHAVTAEQMVLVTLDIMRLGTFFRLLEILWELIKEQQVELYARNRKGFFSFNVQAICDANCMFQDVVCRWPGSTHDSHIFANSNVRARFEQGVFNEYVLVGDSGYAIKNYLITPLHNPVTRQEQLFNESQIRTRNCIERKFGQWKRRFLILAFGIRFKVEKVEAVVIATAVLDNIAKLLNEVDPPVTEEEEAVINLVANVNDDHPDINVYNMHDVNNIVRHQLINYFNDLALG
nr:unnamed protein product [Callosobruchus chinensis]